MLLGVLGTDRPDGQPLAVRRRPVLGQFDRIRRDRQPAAGIARLAQTQPGIRRHDAIGIDDQRVQVQFGDLREIDDELADPHQRLRHRRLVRRRIVAEPRQRRRRARAGDQAMRQRQVQRRQVGGDVAQDVRRGAAVAEADDRPERGIVGHLDPQFAPADRLALHQQRRAARVDSCAA